MWVLLIYTGMQLLQLLQLLHLLHLHRMVWTAHVLLVLGVLLVLLHVVSLKRRLVRMHRLLVRQRLDGHFRRRHLPHLWKRWPPMMDVGGVTVV